MNNGPEICKAWCLLHDALKDNAKEHRFVWDNEADERKFSEIIEALNLIGEFALSQHNSERVRLGIKTMQVLRESMLDPIP